MIQAQTYLYVQKCQAPDVASLGSNRWYSDKTCGPLKTYTWTIDICRFHHLIILGSKTLPEGPFSYHKIVPRYQKTARERERERERGVEVCVVTRA